MDRFDQYRIFVQVAQRGSFIRAADALGYPRATVSAAVRQLEARMGVALLHRTTRHVRLTADGADLLDRVKPLLAEVDDIDQLFQLGGEAAGTLTVDVPSRIARRLIVPALPEWLAAHPRLRLVLRSTDRAVDLVREGVDCVVRVGALEPGGLAAHDLGHIGLINCASPAYLTRRKPLRTPRDLADGHQMVGYASPRTGRILTWEFGDEGSSDIPDVPDRVVVNNAENYIACCRAGLGLIQIPRYDVQHLLDSGALIEVLPAFRPAPMPVALLYPNQQPLPPRVAAFKNWFRELMRPYLDS